MTISTAATVFALVASSLASASNMNYIRTRDQAENTKVQTSIEAWNTDVIAVNNFLNTVSEKLDDLPALATYADSVSQNAQDEPTQLGVLTSFVNSGFPTEAFKCATGDLAVGETVGSTTFNFKALVIDVFADIVTDANAGNRDGVTNSVDVVNSYRCCNVLPDLDIIWRDAAQSAGFTEVDVPFTPPRPDACGAIDCSTVDQHSTCASQSNTVLGTDFGTPGS
jgi:hypothetical protein